MRVVAGILYLLGSGPACDGGMMEPPAADAPGRDAACPAPSGRGYIQTRLHILPAAEGFDLDGDGDIDNMIGNVPALALASANQGLDDAIATGEFLMFYLIQGWDEPLDPSDPTVTLNAFRVYDEDMPPDPSNNFDGEGRFLMSLLKFDLDCRSRTEADTTTLSGGVLTATNDLWRFIFPTGLGALELQDARVETTFSPDLVTGMGRLGARTTLCSLSELTFPGETPGSVLDVFVNDPAIRAAVSVDVDRDGDGFEQVEGDGVTVLHCVDGDGTIIPGSSCPCHPAIADGYTVAIGIEIVHGQVVGVL